MKTPGFVVALLAALLSTLSVAAAQTIGFNASGTLALEGDKGITGFNFKVTQEISVTSLGFFASSIGGGDTPHISLFDVTSMPSLLADTGNMNDSLVMDTWNYATLSTPVTLVPGNTYQVTAPVYWSPVYGATDAANFTYGPGILSQGFYLTDGFFANGSWNFPAGASGPVATGLQTSNVAIAADFKYNVVPVPEPGTVALLVAVGVGVFVMRLGRA